MRNSIKKAAVCLLLGCFVFTALPVAAFAAKHHSQYDNRYGHKRPDRGFIKGYLSLEDRHVGYLYKNRMTLRDVIIAKCIADESRRIDTEDVLRMKKRGMSYKSIAKRYNIKWSRVERNLDDVHRDMKRETLRAGLTLWALDEILN